MPAALPVILALALLGSVPAAAQSSSTFGSAPRTRRIILQANASRMAFEVHISPEVPTLLIFDTPLRPEGLVLERHEHFRWWMGANAHVLNLLPSEQVQPGDRLSLTVRFADGVAPASANFALIAAEPARAELVVEVFRPPVACASCWQKAEEERATALQCQFQLAQVRMACRMVPDDLADLLASRRMNESGIQSIPLTPLKDFTPGAEDVLTVLIATSYRARDRVAVDMWLKNESFQPWTAAGAELVNPGGVRLKVVRVWQPEAIPPDGRPARLMVEAEAATEEARGPFTLVVKGEGGAGGVTLDGVTFP